MGFLKSVKKAVTGGGGGGSVIGGSALASFGGSLLGAGASIYGGIQDRQLSEKLFKDNLDWQRELATTGIQKRVADAKKGGIHPLYALGAQTHSSPAIPVGQASNLAGALGSAGQSIGGAIGKLMNKEAQRAASLQNSLLESQIGETDARKNYYQSMAAKERQGISGLGVQSELPGGNSQPKMLYKEDQIAGQMPLTAGSGFVDIQPVPQKSGKIGKPGLMAGENPGYQEFILPGGQPIQLPASEEGSLSEVLEAVPWLAWPGIIQYNNRFYGDPWAQDFRDWTLWGKEAKSYYPRARSRKKKNFYRKDSPSDLQKGFNWLKDKLRFRSKNPRPRR